MMRASRSHTTPSEEPPTNQSTMEPSGKRPERGRGETTSGGRGASRIRKATSGEPGGASETTRLRTTPSPRHNLPAPYRRAVACRRRRNWCVGRSGLRRTARGQTGSRDRRGRVKRSGGIRRAAVAETLAPTRKSGLGPRGTIRRGRRAWTPQPCESIDGYCVPQSERTNPSDPLTAVKSTGPPIRSKGASPTRECYGLCIPPTRRRRPSKRPTRKRVKKRHPPKSTPQKLGRAGLKGPSDVLPQGRAIFRPISPETSVG